MKKINGRYILKKIIKRSSQHIEYLAEDTFNGEIKGMIMFEVDKTNVDFVDDMNKNFITYSSYNHPSLLATHKYGKVLSINNRKVYRNEYFFTFDVFTQYEEIDYLSINEEEKKRILSDILKVLLYFEFRGYTYRYVNFENIKLYKDSNKEIFVKFNNVVSSKFENLGKSFESSVNSEFYPPEFFWNSSDIKESDVYSLGILLYYLIYNIDYKNEQIDRFYLENEKSDISKFISKATNVVSSNRFGNCQEMSKTLIELLGIEFKISNEEYEKINAKTRIVGIDKLINNTIEKMKAQETESSTHKFVHLVGEEGIGKSRILSELKLKLDTDHGVRTISIDCTDNSKSLLEKIVSLFFQGKSFTGSEKYLAELAYLMPEISKTYRIENVEDMTKERLLNRITNFLAEMSLETRLILLLDNIDDISEEVVLLLDQLLNIKNSNLFGVLTSNESIENLSNNPTVYETKLQRLTIEATGRYIQLILGMNSIPYVFTHRLYNIASGNPQKTKAMVDELYKSGEIFVENRRWILDRIASDYFSNLNSKNSDINLFLSRKFSMEESELLKMISVFKDSFTSVEISEAFNLEVDYVNLNLGTLLDKGVLKRQISDTSYYFAFRNEKEKEIHRKNLARKQFLKLNQLLIDYYLKIYDYTGVTRKELTFYLQKNGQMEKAGECYKKIVKEQIYRNSYLEAIDTLNEAYIIFEKLNIKNEKIGILIEISNLFLELGNIEDAIKKINIAYLLIKEDDFKEIIDCQNVFGKIKAKEGNFVEAIEIFEKNIKLAQRHDYFEGELVALDEYLYRLSNEREYRKSKELIEKYLKDKKYNSNLEMIFMLKNRKGVINLRDNNVDGAIKEFNEVLDYYKKLNKFEKVAKILNNLGNAYLDIYGDLKKAKNYFEMAFEVAKKSGNNSTIPTYMNNLGEVEIFEENYNKAIKTLLNALDFSQKYSEKNIEYSININLAKAYLFAEEYGKSYIFLNKLIYEYNNDNLTASHKEELFLLRLEFNLKVNDIKKAYEIVEKQEILYEPCSTGEYATDILKFNIKFSMDNRIDFNVLNNLKAAANSTMKIREIRNLLMDMCFSMFLIDNKEVIKKILEIDLELKNRLNSKLIDEKRDVISGLFVEEQLEFYENMIDNSEKITAENKWVILSYIGLKYMESDKYYQALKYLVESWNVINELSKKLPENIKYSYIVNDKRKMKMRNGIDYIVNYFLEKNEVGEKDNYIPSDLDRFYDLDDIESVISTDKFAILKNDAEGKIFHETSVKELTKTVNSNESENIISALKYLQDLSMTEKAYLFIVDDNENISKVIKSSPEIEDYDVNKLLKIIGKETEGVFANSLDNQIYSHILAGKEKGKIIFPIYTIDNYVDNDRLGDDKIVSAYVLLITDNIINRVNKKVFKECLETVNFIYLMIDYYNLKEVATIDKLTGVSLRKHVEQIFSIEIANARSSNVEFSVLMLDIDKFKNVNDTYGHRTGDEVLRKIGHILKTSLNAKDHVGRYGGEEFLVILPKTTSDDAFKIAEELREIIESQDMLGNGQKITVSLGASTFPHNGNNEGELIEKADQALYHSKNSGRNKTTTWSKEMNASLQSYNKLAGILTGHASEDARLVQDMIDIMSLIGKNKIMKEMLINILDITQGDNATVVVFDSKGDKEHIFVKNKADNKLYNTTDLNSEMMFKLSKEENGNYFIDWNYKLEGINKKEKKYTWNSYIYVPVSVNDKKAILLLGSEIEKKEFSFADLNVINSLKNLIESLIESEIK